MLKTIIRVPNHLGDCLMARGAIRAFAEMTPDRELFLLLPEWSRVLYRDIPYIRFIPVSKDYMHGFKAVRYQTGVIRKERFGSGILMTPSFSSALIMFLGGVKSRYGYDTDYRSPLLNVKITVGSNTARHRSEQYHLLLERAAGHRLNRIDPPLPCPEEALDEAEQILARHRIGAEPGFVVIAPQAVAESRRWGRANYAALVETIREKHQLTVVLLGTGEEHAAGQEIKGNRTGIVNLCGKTDLATAAAVMSRARLFIGNDSGLAHLAAAVRTPLVVLSGADNPSETSPRSDNKTVIIKDDLHCISCVKNVCPLKDDRFMQCMKKITVAEVYAAVKSRGELS